MDGWAIEVRGTVRADACWHAPRVRVAQMLRPENVEYASVCNSLGQTGACIGESNLVVRLLTRLERPQWAYSPPPRCTSFSVTPRRATSTSGAPRVPMWACGLAADKGVARASVGQHRWPHPYFRLQTVCCASRVCWRSGHTLFWRAVAVLMGAVFVGVTLLVAVFTHERPAISAAGALACSARGVLTAVRCAVDTLADAYGGMRRAVALAPVRQFALVIALHCVGCAAVGTRAARRDDGCADGQLRYRGCGDVVRTHGARGAHGGVCDDAPHSGACGGVHARLSGRAACRCIREWLFAFVSLRADSGGRAGVALHVARCIPRAVVRARARCTWRGGSRARPGGCQAARVPVARWHLHGDGGVRGCGAAVGDGAADARACGCGRDTGCCGSGALAGCWAPFYVWRARCGRR